MQTKTQTTAQGLLAALAAACLLGVAAARLVNETRAVGVEVDRPWFVRFAVPVAANFVPLSLRARVQASETDADAAADDLRTDFSLHCEHGRVVFRNTMPLLLEPGVPVLGQLQYGTGGPGEREVKHVRFSYVVDTKQFDVMQLVAAVEQDSVPTVAAATQGDDAEDAPGARPDLCLFYSNETRTQGSPAWPPSRLPSQPGRAPAPSRTTSTTSTTSTTTTRAPQRPQAAPDAGAAQPTDGAALCEQPVPCPPVDDAYQTALLQTALDLGKIGPRLLLKGPQPPGATAVDAIRAIITGKLQLPHLSLAIVQAHQTEEGLLFEMATPHQKLEVLTKGRVLLQRSPYWIDSTEREFYDVSLHRRGDFDRAGPGRRQRHGSRRSQ